MTGREPSLVWLASYPSSGNTWLRILLINLMRGGTGPADINTLVEVGHAADRSWFDACSAVAASDLTTDEIEELRPVVYETVAAERGAPFFIKIHDTCGHTPTGHPLVPPRVTRGVVYVIRNPLDVAVSYAHHRAASLDEVIEIMADDRHTLEPVERGLFPLLPQRVGSWSQHVRSWVDAPGLCTHVLRYEDMKEAPLERFAALARFVGLAHTPEQLRRAIAFSDFAELRRQEEHAGFAERSLRASRLFRRGEAGEWRRELSSSQVERIVASHGDVMRSFGYLDEESLG